MSSDVLVRMMIQMLSVPSAVRLIQGIIYPSLVLRGTIAIEDWWAMVRYGGALRLLCLRPAGYGKLRVIPGHGCLLRLPRNHELASSLASAQGIASSSTFQRYAL